MGVFSDLEILRAIKDGWIICYPLNPKHIKGASLDVTLGEWFYLTDRSGTDPYYNFYSEAEVKRYFGEAQRAISHQEWCDRHNRRLFDGIPPEALIIVLKPHERILAHTNEFVGIRFLQGTTQMQARSTIGRNGVVVCKDAGWGDPDYWNRWTMEIQNDNDHYVVLVAGQRVAQIVFSQTGLVGHSYSGDKYQSGEKTLEGIVGAWTPEAMLPKLYLDPIEPLVPATVEGIGEYRRQLEELEIPG
jgi:deoxycytidine triphosphate deaminase